MRWGSVNVPGKVSGVHRCILDGGFCIREVRHGLVGLFRKCVVQVLLAAASATQRTNECLQVRSAASRWLHATTIAAMKRCDARSVSSDEASGRGDLALRASTIQQRGSYCTATQLDFALLCSFRTLQKCGAS